MIPLLNLTFQINAGLLPWVLILTLLIWAIILWKTFHRMPQRWRIARMILVSLAMGSLRFIALQPASVVKTTPGTAILITSNSSTSQLDSVKNRLPGAGLFSLDTDEREGVYLSDLGQLSQLRPEVQELYIIGDGLHPDDLALLDNYQVHFLLNAPPEGIVDLSYTEQVIAGQDFQIEGLYHQNTKKEKRLFLESPAGNRELLALDSSGAFVFKTHFPTKEPGRFLFKLRTEGSDRQILNEAFLPVVVKKAKRPEILILNAAPSFETNYLKNWLADEGYPLAVRSLVSRDKFRMSFHNRPEGPLQMLTSGLLSEFDLLVMSNYTLANLPSGERQAIQQAIKDGLGLCLLADSPFPPAQLARADRQFFLDFPFATGADNWTAVKGVTLEKIPLQIGADIGLAMLATGTEGETIAAFRLKGKGRLGINLVPDTYQLLLNGQTAVYQDFWTPILTKTARAEQKKVQFFMPQNPVLLPNQPLQLQLWTTFEDPMAILMAPDSSTTPLSLGQHPFDREVWEGRFYGVDVGWYWGRVDGGRWTVDGGGVKEVKEGERGEGGTRGEGRGTDERGEQDDGGRWTVDGGGVKEGERGEEGEKREQGGWFYLQEEGSWESLRIARQLEQNKQWVAKQQGGQKKQVEPVDLTKPIPLWWFYLIFLLAAGTLWLEEKW